MLQRKEEKKEKKKETGNRCRIYKKAYIENQGGS
jgi:hypothetical protein